MSNKTIWHLLMYSGRYHKTLQNNVRNLFSHQEVNYCALHNFPLSKACFHPGKSCTPDICKKCIKCNCLINDCLASNSKNHFKSKRFLWKVICLPEDRRFRKPICVSKWPWFSGLRCRNQRRFQYRVWWLKARPLLICPRFIIHPQGISSHDALHVFSRNLYPKRSQKFLRYFQNYAANYQDIISFVQSEAPLCRSVFYKQNDDGIFLGALSHFLLNDDILNRQLGFASMYDHVYSRLTNMELPIAATKNAYFLHDALLNCNLPSAPTAHFFERGVQNIIFKGKKLHQVDEQFKYSLVET